MKRYYDHTVSNGCDHLRIYTLDSDWSHIQMTTNGSSNGEITIRSKEQLEQLHFMLGQVLKEDQE